MRKLVCLFLLLLFFSFSSETKRVRHERDVSCDAIAPFPRSLFYLVIDLKGQKYVPTSDYNRLLDYSETSTDCLRKIRCNEQWTEYSRDCAENQVDVLRSSYLPGPFVILTSCKLPKPVCDQR